MGEKNKYTAIGRRKRSVAKVTLVPGKGNITVNGKDVKDYMPYETLVMDLVQPLELADSKEKYDINIVVKGGGFSGQTGAIRLGIARALMLANAEKVNLTGNKLDDKMYYNHSGYPGGLRERNARKMKEKYQVEMEERAVKGMLPKNRLGRQIYKQLFVYAGSEHKHQAQKPERLEVR